MSERPSPQGTWPDGSKGEKHLNVCPCCGWTLNYDAGSGPDQPCEGVCCDEDGLEGQPTKVVPVLPASVARELAEGLEAVEEVGDRAAVLTARQSLASYKQAIGEGDDD